MKKYQPIIIVALIVVMVAGFIFLGQRRSSPYKKTTGIIESQEVAIDEGTRQQAGDRIVEYSAALEDETLSEADRISYLVGLAVQYELLGQYSEAKTHMEGALALGVDSPPLNVTYSRLLYAMRDYENAVLYAEKAVALRPDIATSWLWRVELDENLRRVGVTNEMYDEAIIATGNDLSVLVAYAEYLTRTEQDSRAINVWKQIGDLYPEQLSAAYERIDKLAAKKK